MELKLALKVDDLDNVATIFANGIVDGTQCQGGTHHKVRRVHWGRQP